MTKLKLNCNSKLNLQLNIKIFIGIQTLTNMEALKITEKS